MIGGGGGRGIGTGGGRVITTGRGGGGVITCGFSRILDGFVDDESESVWPITVFVGIRSGIGRGMGGLGG